jgi:IS605 OrfB family transposase
MKLTASVQLLPTDDQRHSLIATLERANAACNDLSEQAWEQRVFNKRRLQKLAYYDIRERFDLTAQIALRCIGKVCDSYKADKKMKRQFRQHGAIPYDSRILSWKLDDALVSIWAVGGRLKVKFASGDYQRQLLRFQQGETDLVLRQGKLYLYTTCEVPKDTEIDNEGYLGVDLGIKNIATDSDGTIYSGKRLLSVRHRHRRLRRKLQQKGTKSAKRRLKKLSGKEKRFANDVNHCISKQLVKTAKGTGRGIALEDLGGIRDRVTVRRRKRDELHSWSFRDLRTKIGYKATLSGVPVVAVNPRNTSRECLNCEHIDKANRRSQAKFKCTRCGHASHADVNAAGVISRRAALVNPPNAVRELGENPAVTASP